jgi:hypothetical protein
LHNDKLQHFTLFSDMKVELDGIGVAGCTHGGVEKRMQMAVKKSEGKKQLGRRAHRWETDFKMYIK